MRVIATALRAVLVLALAAYGGVATAQIPEQFRIVRHDLIIDVPHGEAVFDLWFSETPRLAKFDDVGRQSHGFQFYLEQPDLRNFLKRAHGSPETVYPYLIVGSGEVETGDRAVARMVTPGAQNWGPVVANVDTRQLGRRVTFRLPLSVFDSAAVKPYQNNDWFAVHYFLEAYRFGATTYSLARGVATVGTVAAPLTVHRWDLRTGHGSTRHLLVAHLLAVSATAQNSYFFPAETVDVSSVRFGPNRARPWGNELKDLNGDGREDLVLTFNADDVGLTCIDTDVRLTGEIPSPGNFVPEGTVFIGKAALSPAPCK